MSSRRLRRRRALDAPALASTPALMGTAHDASGPTPPLARRCAASRPARQAEVLHLQRAHGNAHVAALLQRDPAARVVQRAEIPATEQAGAKHQVRQMGVANGGDLASGVWYANVYYGAAHGPDGDPSRWRDDYLDGHADSAAFEQVGYMSWTLRPGRSAAAAVRSWLRGLTIAECMTTIVAIQWETVRAMLGDERFDALFGSADATIDAGIPPARRLVIRPDYKPQVGPDGAETAAASPLLALGLIRPTGAMGGMLGDRPVKEGERYYFANHPKFKTKHPDPANNLIGENALFVGWRDKGDGEREQIWSGLGMTDQTEAQILDTLARVYNEPRSEADYQWVLRLGLGAEELQRLVAAHPDWDYEDLYADNLARLPDYFRDDLDPDLTSDISGRDLDLLDPATDPVTGRLHAPGFRPGSGIALDATRVAQLAG